MEDEVNNLELHENEFCIGWIPIGLFMVSADDIIVMIINVNLILVFVGMYRIDLVNVLIVYNIVLGILNCIVNIRIIRTDNGTSGLTKIWSFSQALI